MHLIIVSWSKFLREWDTLHLADLEQLYEGEEDAELPGTFLQPPATVAAIADAEKRLGIQLPPAHLELLQVTNGWPVGDPLDPGSMRLLPVEEVAWFADSCASMLDSWAKPLEGTPEEDTGPSIDGEAEPCEFMVSHLRRTLLISSDCDGDVILLNPQRRTSHGYWEAWLLSPQLPGAARYASLHHLLRSERASLQGRIDAA